MITTRVRQLLQNGAAHHRANRLAEAETSYRQARALAPRSFEVLHLSGLLAYQQDRMADAVELLERAHRLEPRHAACEMRLGVALQAMRRPGEAEAHLRRAVQTKPEMVEGWDHLAYCLKTQDRLAEAAGCHQRSVEIKPNHAPGWHQYGLTLNLLGRTTEALNCQERALAADPGFAQARLGRAQALHKASRMAEAVAEYRRFLAVNPEHLESRSNLLLALHNLEGLAREELFAEHVAYGRVLPEKQAAARALPNLPADDRRLRLAILSPDLRAHSCAYFFEPLLQHLDRAQFEVYLYHDHFREDAVSERLKARAAVWRNFLGQPGPQVEQAIRGDAPDVLIDLAGHTGLTNRLPLFARRLAPVQVTYLGYPDTTGVPAMDYRFTDSHADPEGDADRFATERLVRFAPTAWAYQAPAVAPEVGPLPAATRREVTFGCCNNPGKLTDGMLKCWARLLALVPDSRLLLKGLGLGERSEQERFGRRLQEAGLPGDRVVLLERTPEVISHLAVYGQVDVALDTFPYHGTTTTCEALWMGVPVVTLAGDRHASRVGVSLLHAVGHPEWIAREPEEYVQAAAKLAADRDRLAHVRGGLRAEMRRSPLLDHAGQAARFGAALRTLWANWCEQTAGRSKRGGEEAGSIGGIPTVGKCPLK